MLIVFQAIQLALSDHLVGNQHVAHTGVDQRFGFADFLAAHAHRAQLHLTQRDHRAFVRFGMGSHAHRGDGCGPRYHAGAAV